MRFLPSLLCVILSIVLGGLTLLLFWLFIPVQSGGDSYFLLSVDQSVPDRDAGSLLKAAQFDTFYSESQTVVYYDDFGSPKSVFLDEASIFESFDPRNDGYAEELRSFFVNNGRRYFFIPLQDSADYRQTERTLVQAVASLPYTLDLLNPGRNVIIWFIFQLAAIIPALIVSRDKLRFALIIPVILAFAWSAHSGLILSCVLIGIWELQREVFEDLFSPNPYGNIWYRLRPHISSMLWIALFCVLYGVLVTFINIPPVPAWTGFLGMTGIQALSFIDLKKSRQKSNWFAPISIFTPSVKKKVFCISMTAFTSVVFVAITLTILFPGLFLQSNGRNTRGSFDLPSASDYQEHMLFQSSFSYLPLGFNAGEYNQYFLGDDGLIAGFSNTGIKTQWEIPVFPLEKLAAFLVNYNNRQGTLTLPDFKDWVSMALIMLACVPFRLRTGRNSVRKISKFPDWLEKAAS